MELFEPPTEQRKLVRHYTLSDAALVAIRRCRGDHNRLGYALMLCYLRFPGRALRARERPPAPLLVFVADQIDVLPDGIDEYLATERNRQRHAIERQDQLGLRLFGRRAAAELREALLREAIKDDRLSVLAGAVTEAAKASAMLGIIERLEHVRAIGIEPGRGHFVHQARLAQLAREAGCTTVQHVAGYERQRRHATLVATTLDITASLTDQAIELFERLVGAMFRKAEGRHARAFQVAGSGRIAAKLSMPISMSSLVSHSSQVRRPR